MQEPARKRIRVMEDSNGADAMTSNSSQTAQFSEKHMSMADSQITDSQSTLQSSQETVANSLDMFDGLEEDYIASSQNQESDHDDCSRGASLDRLPRVGVTVGSQFAPPTPSHNHTVLVDLSRLDVNKIPEPYPLKPRDAWDGRHVRLPWSSENKYPVTLQGRKQLMPRWELITTALTKLISRETITPNDVKEAVLSYNSRYADAPSWSFIAFEALFQDFEEEEQEMLMKEVLPGMVRLCLQGPTAITNTIPLLRAKVAASITLSQHQVSVLLANAFFCTFPRRNTSGRDAEYSNYPDINFNRLLSFNDRRQEAKKEKLKTLFSYFKQIIDNPSTGLMTFSRQVIEPASLPSWPSLNQTFDDSSLRLASAGTIEADGLGMLQADFANKFVGGGVLGHGLVQEEIRFIICPELIVSRLFTEVLEDNEALIVHGVQQYSRYKGYADAYKYDGRFVDTTELDVSSRRQTTIVAMDAIRFTSAKNQFKREALLRELNKAFVAFHPTNQSSSNCSLNAVATGNWGCGAFRGNPQLKMLLQCMAARAVNRKVCYFTFSDSDLVRLGWEMYSLLVEHKVTLGSLFNILLEYDSQVCSKKEKRAIKKRHGSSESLSVFEFVSRRVLGLETSPMKQDFRTSLKNKSPKERQDELYNVDTDNESETLDGAPDLFDDSLNPPANSSVSIDETSSCDMERKQVSSSDQAILDEYKTDATGQMKAAHEVLGQQTNGHNRSSEEDFDKMEKGMAKVAAAYRDSGSGKATAVVGGENKGAQGKITDYFGRK